MNEEAEVNHSHKALADFRQRPALGETEVIHHDIGAREDKGYFTLTLLPLPIGHRSIDKSVGNTLEEQLGVEHLLAIYRHHGVNLVF